MIKSKDEIATFIPDDEPRFIILGTMGAINTRTINGVKPQDVFFYNNSRNHFWRVLQLVFEPLEIAKLSSVSEKKAFLNKYKIAMTNIVQEIEILEKDINNPSDDILFKAHRSGKLKFKSEPLIFRELMQSKPIFFTCREKKNIQLLVNGYCEENELKDFSNERVWFLPTPTRCNPESRSLIWRNEMAMHMKAKL